MGSVPLEGTPEGTPSRTCRRGENHAFTKQRYGSSPPLPGAVERSVHTAECPSLGRRLAQSKNLGDGPAASGNCS